jgi:phospholipid/cholesterol/gamma-HCH transport system permease protein
MDIFTSLLKGATFGLLIGLIATNIGFRTARATEAVGTSTTKSMVQAVLAILVADLVITKTVLVFSE